MTTRVAKITRPDDDCYFFNVWWMCWPQWDLLLHPFIVYDGPSDKRMTISLFIITSCPWRMLVRCSCFGNIDNVPIFCRFTIVFLSTQCFFVCWRNVQQLHFATSFAEVVALSFGRVSTYSEEVCLSINIQMIEQLFFLRHKIWGSIPAN